MPVLDELHHVAVEKGEQQRTDVGAVNVGVGHYDDAMVAQLGDIELGAVARAHSGNQSADLVVRQHFFGASLLHVQDLALKRQYRLKAPIPPLLRRTTGGVPFNDV